MLPILADLLTIVEISKKNLFQSFGINHFVLPLPSEKKE
jgi:hypothetical protein